MNLTKFLTTSILKNICKGLLQLVDDILKNDVVVSALKYLRKLLSFKVANSVVILKQL